VFEPGRRVLELVVWPEPAARLGRGFGRAQPVRRSIGSSQRSTVDSASGPAVGDTRWVPGASRLRVTSRLVGAELRSPAVLG